MSDSRLDMWDDTMDIYSEPGTKIRFAYPDAGYPIIQLKAARYLTVGQVYTVEKTDVHSSSTAVYLREFPDIPFNSTSFAGVDSERWPEFDSSEGV